MASSRSKKPTRRDFLKFMGVASGGLGALAPGDRYQVMEAILTKGWASPLIVDTYGRPYTI